MRATERHFVRAIHIQFSRAVTVSRIDEDQYTAEIRDLTGTQISNCRKQADRDQISMCDVAL